MDCIFCKITKGELPSYKVYEDDKVLVFLNINPETNGDCLLIPKEHYETILDIPLDDLSYMNKVTKDMYSLLREKLNCEGLTIAQNNDLGQEIKHFHIHLTPRYKDDLREHNYNKGLLEKTEDIYIKIKGD